MATRQESLRGRLFWASSDERVDCQTGPPRLLTLYSPALRVGAGKSGAGGGEWKVDADFCSFSRQIFKLTQQKYLHSIL